MFLIVFSRRYLTSSRLATVRAVRERRCLFELSSFCQRLNLTLPLRCLKYSRTCLKLVDYYERSDYILTLRIYTKQLHVSNPNSETVDR